MSGGSKTQTTTSTQSRDPYAPAIPTLQTILAGANNAYSSGVGSQVYGGQRVAGLGDPTPQVGLLAQDVARRDPGAVAMRPDGLLAVDYDRALSGSKAAGRDHPAKIRKAMKERRAHA